MTPYATKGPEWMSKRAKELQKKFRAKRVTYSGIPGDGFSVELANGEKKMYHHGRLRRHPLSPRT